jgi:folate-binding protein YgfZ
VSEATQEILRVEAGRPAFHVDMDEQTIPLEAGLESRAISMTKGCYIGQEVIVRVLHRGHGRIGRKLVGLVLDGSTPAAPGDRIEAGEREGVVTSAVVSPRVGGPIALGYVHRETAVAGNAVTISHQGALLPARVVDLPFRRTHE